MRKILSYLLIAVVGLLYLASTMGYGIHKCNKDGTQNVVLVYGEVSCEALHSHLDGEGHVYSHSHEHSNCGCSSSDNNHNDKCCNTVVYTVTSDQTFEDNSINILPVQQDLFFIASILNDISLEEAVNVNVERTLDYRKLRLSDNPLHIFNRTIII